MAVTGLAGLLVACAAIGICIGLIKEISYEERVVLAVPSICCLFLASSIRVYALLESIIAMAPPERAIYETRVFLCFRSIYTGLLAFAVMSFIYRLHLYRKRAQKKQLNDVQPVSEFAEFDSELSKKARSGHQSAI